MGQVSVNGIFRNNIFNNPRGFIVGELLSGWLLYGGLFVGATFRDIVRYFQRHIFKYRDVYKNKYYGMPFSLLFLTFITES